MKLPIAFFQLAVVMGLSNLGFMRAVSNRVPAQISRNAFAQSITGIPYRQPVLRNHEMRIQKSGIVKSRRHRNIVTNEMHYDQPLLYRTNPTYAMRPEVMDRIRFPYEIKPTA